MREFLFYTAIYGAAVSIAVLQVGAPIRRLFTAIDRFLFPSLWRDDLPEDRRGGPLRILIHCPACVSFWIALFGSVRIYSPARTHFAIPFVDGLILDGFSSVAIIWFVHVVMTKLGQYGL